MGHAPLDLFIQYHNGMSLGICMILSSPWLLLAAYNDKIMTLLPCQLNCAEAVISGDVFFWHKPSHLAETRKKCTKSLRPLNIADLACIRIGALDLKVFVFPHQLSPWAIHYPIYSWLPAFLQPSGAWFQRKVKCFVFQQCPESSI